VAITALCYKAFRPFAKIVLNNQFVRAARSKTNPSTPTSLQQRLSGRSSKSKKTGTDALATPATPAKVASFRDHHDDVTAAAVSPIHADVPVVVEQPVRGAKTVVLPPIKHASTVVVELVVPAVLPEIGRAGLGMQTAHLQGLPRAGTEAIASTVNDATATADNAVDVGTVINMTAVEGNTWSQETHDMSASDVTYASIGEHAEQLSAVTATTR
jgi:hypothetical protein